MKNLWVPLSGAIAQQYNVDTIANNVANANTPGFKKDSLVFKEYLTALERTPASDNLRNNKEWKPEDFYHSQGAEKGLVEVEGSYTDHGQGRLSPTGNPLDLAINGKGMFEVMTPAGIRFTRKGLFGLDATGRLVNDQGHILLSKTEPAARLSEADPYSRAVILPTSSKVSINLQGEVFADSQKVADLSVVEFIDQTALKKEGNSHFIAQDLANISTAQTTSNIHQGFIEESNVNAIEEMAQLIKANRNFESIQKVIKAYDAMSERGINEISKF